MPPLPEECLWLVVSYLSQDRATLHSLLLTSPTFFRIALPYLYASPFRLLHTEPNWHWTVVEKTRRYDRLLHLLLTSSNLLTPSPRSQKEILETPSGLLSTATRLPNYGPEVHHLPSPATVDYLSFYTDMFHDPMVHETFMTLFPTIPNCYHDNVLWYKPMVELRNRIELAILDRHSPQLTSLAVSMPMQVPRVKLGWMPNLRRIEVLGTDFGLLTDQDLELPKTAMASRVLSRSHGPWMTRLDQMVAFIQEHNRTFGTLRELQIENKAVAKELQPGDRLIELVEAMGDRLQRLDVQYWPGAVLYLDMIPLQNLRSLLLHRGKDFEPVLERSESMAVFLEHCPILSELSVYSNEKDLLSAWRPRIPNAAASTPDPPYHYYRSPPGPKSRDGMKRIDLAGLAENMIAVGNEASDLFSSTLESLTLYTWFNGRLTTMPLSWSATHLPRLMDLDLEGEVAWSFDYSSLLNCPRLSRLRLAFTGPMPRKAPTIEYIIQVPSLQNLELVGKWETLYNKGWANTICRMRALERLDLGACEGISAEQIMMLVKATFDHAEKSSSSIRRQLRPSQTGDEKSETGSLPLVEQEYLGQCRLCWVVASKRLEDHLWRLWYDYGRTMVSLSAFKQASYRRVRFSYLAVARPSR